MSKIGWTIFKTLWYITAILFLYILYLLWSTGQYWYYITVGHYYTNFNTFKRIQSEIEKWLKNGTLTENNIDNILDLLNLKISDYHFRQSDIWNDIEVIKLYKEFWLNEKNFIITYDDWEHTSEYNNSYKISKRISWNRWYKSDVNWRSSDDF